MVEGQHPQQARRRCGASRTPGQEGRHPADRTGAFTAAPSMRSTMRWSATSRWCAPPPVRQEHTARRLGPQRRMARRVALSLSCRRRSDRLLPLPRRCPSTAPVCRSGSASAPPLGPEGRIPVGEGLATALVNGLAGLPEECAGHRRLPRGDVGGGPPAMSFLLDDLPGGSTYSSRAGRTRPCPWRGSGPEASSPSCVRRTCGLPARRWRPSFGRGGLDLSPEAVAALETRTEGWGVGLELAAPSLRERPDPDAFPGGLRRYRRLIGGATRPARTRGVAASRRWREKPHRREG